MNEPLEKVDYQKTQNKVYQERINILPNLLYLS